MIVVRDEAEEIIGLEFVLRFLMFEFEDDEPPKNIRAIRMSATTPMTMAIIGL